VDTHQLTVFLAVYKHRSFSRASREIGLKQPTVSTHIQSLEKQLGCRLFDRTGQKVIPTPEARVLAGFAESMIDLESSLKTAVTGVTHGLEGRIILGASTIPASYILPGAAASFRKLHPEVTFEIQTGDTRHVTDLVISHELLAGFVGAQFAHPSLRYQEIAEDELLITSIPEMIEKKAYPASAVEKMPMIMREAGSGTRQAMERIFRRQGLDPGKLNVTGVFGSTEAVKQAVFAGLGVAVISKYAVAGDVEQGTLKVARLQGVEMKRSFSLVTHKTRSLPAAYKEFVKHLMM
jgi:DNA-binding transcriptional LysR family regulator